jgi:hypothetical protein
MKKVVSDFAFAKTDKTGPKNDKDYGIPYDPGHGINFQDYDYIEILNPADMHIYSSRLDTPITFASS